MFFLKYWFLTGIRKTKGLHTKLSVNQQLNTAHIHRKLGLMQNAKGQGLIEYLIIVGIMAIASLGAIRLLNKTVNTNFTNIIYSLQGKRKKAKMETPKENLYKKRDFKNFMNGAASNSKTK